MSNPKHIAFIMDGNGRWASKRGLPRGVGHQQGAKVLRPLLEAIGDKGIQCVTLFAFSSENWGRPKEEVDGLMNLFRRYLKEEINQLVQKGIKIIFMGNRLKFPEDIQDQMNDLELKTKKNQKLILAIALSYGAREDILQAVQKILVQVEKGTLKQQEITEDVFSKYLSSNALPPLDLLIRTSGEQRISNFLLWESAYAELYFSPKLWPDFTKEDLEKALEDYGNRQRRFGKI